MHSLPASIKANRTIRFLTIHWEDGHISTYPFGLLRAACPCASCRGGHEYMHDEPDEAVFTLDLPESQATRMRKIEGVGNYALTIEWEDGHHYGIFNWGYLRKLCMCETCRPTNDQRSK